MAAAEDADLEAELLADSKTSSGCSVCVWLEGREDADKWDRAFLNPQITKAAILRGMARRGFRGKATPVATHANEKHRVQA
jgi:hypothetical protein